MATAYFDLLTYPMAALGIPLVGVFACREQTSLKEDLKCLVKLGVVFGIGYGGMWAGKWLLTYLLCDPWVFGSVAGSIDFRTSRSGKEGEAISVLGMYVRNLGGFFLNPGVVAALLYAAGLLAVKAKKHTLRLYKPLPLLACALIPFAWFFVTANHAYIHCYFTCRAFLVTALAVLVSLAFSGPVGYNEKKLKEQTAKETSAAER